MMDEACRSDKHLRDGQVKFLTCFNFWYVCGALRILFATASFACVHTLRPVSQVVFMLFLLLTICTFFFILWFPVSSFLTIFLRCHFFPSLPIALPCVLFCFLYPLKFLKRKGICYVSMM